MKKIEWLESFAFEQAAKLEKTASLNKKAAQIIVNRDDVPSVVNGQEVTYKNEKYTVVDASFKDEIGDGVVLEKLGDGEEAVEGEEVVAALENNQEKTPVEEEKEEVPAEEIVEVTNTEVPTTDVPVAPISVSGQPIGTQQKVTDSPERARTNPGDIYDIGDVRDQVEPAKFDGEAKATEQQIAQENSVDRTVMENRTPNRIFNRMMTDFHSQPPVPTAAEEEDLKELDLPNEDAVETPVEEAPMVEEVPAEEAPEMEQEMGTDKEEEKEDKLAKNRILRKILSGK